MPNQILEIPLSRIHTDPNQPRTQFDHEALAELAKSLVARGLLQPIGVEFDAKRDSYMILTGESRYRAAMIAGWETITCLVHESKAAVIEMDRLADRLTENVCRCDLAPMDEAIALRKLKLLKGGATSKQIADEYGFSEARLSRAEALCRLPEAIQSKVGTGQGMIPASAAVELARLDGHPNSQMELAEAILEGRITRDDAAKKVRELLGTRAPRKARIPLRYGDISITVASDQPLSVSALKQAVRSLQKALKGLKEDVAPSELAELLS